jgi:hypothetical protein
MCGAFALDATGTLGASSLKRYPDEQGGQATRFPSATPPVLLDGLLAGVPVA